MNKENIIRIFKYLGSRDIREGEGYIMGNCPFAKVLHKHGTDRNPSFGISVGKTSTYHCFACGVKGILRNLPSSLSKVYKQSFRKLSDFINKHEGIMEISHINKDRDIIEVLPSSKLNAFPPIKHDWMFIKLNTLMKYNIREYNGYVIIPIYLNTGELVGIKYRSGRTFFTDGKFKKYGAFFGMQFKLKKDEPLFLVEGERDAMLLNQFGINNVWAISGSLSKAQIKKLKYAHHTYILFFDNDETGKKYKEEVVTSLYKIKELFVVKDYCGCKDPAELYEKNLIETAMKSISPINYIKTIHFLLDKNGNVC